MCQGCRQPVRPNINLKNDLDWDERIAQKQSEAFSKWVEPRMKRSMTVLEIGAGPVQPLARSVGEDFLLNDKYRCALLRLNPVKERVSQYKWEILEFSKLIRETTSIVYGTSTDIDKVPDFLKGDFSHVTKEEDA